MVVQAALEKDRGRRYATAQDLAEDLRRVRLCKPIAARPVSVLGRVVRWARRSPALAASLALAFVSLAVGLAASLVFLRDAQQALGREQSVRLAWYDGLSREVAAQDLRGEFTSLHVQLQERAVAMIDEEAPGFEARVHAANAQLANSTDRADIQLPIDLGEALTHARSDLGRGLGVCASDWYHCQARRLYTKLVGHRRTAERLVAMREFARRAVECAVGLPPDDLRVMRARALWLDVLLDLDQVDACAREALQYLAPDAAATIARHSARTAVYESRLGAARLRQGATEEAAALLRRSVPLVVRKFPQTILAFGARAYLLELHDALGEVQAARRQRDELCRVLSRATNYIHTLLGHRAPAFVEAAIGPQRSGLWQWYLDMAAVGWTGGSDEAFVDRMAARLASLREQYGIADDDPVLGLLYMAYTVTANDHAWQRGWQRPLTERLFRLAADLAASCPDAVASEGYLTTLNFLGFVLARRAKLEESERVFARALLHCPTGTPLRAYIEGSRGLYLIETGQYEEAEEVLAAAFVVDLPWFGPASGDTHWSIKHIVTLYRRWGRLDDAVRWHRRQVELWDGPGRRVNFAYTLFSFGRWDATEAEVDRALAFDPLQGRALRLRARIALARGEYARAIEWARDGVAQGVKRCRRILARALFRSGAVAEALEVFESEARAKTKFEGGQFWSDYGLALAAAGRLDDAVATLRDLTKRSPRRFESWLARAAFLCRVEGASPALRQEAVDCAQKAHEIAGGRVAYPLALLAEAQQAAGRPAAAAATMAAVVAGMDDRDAQWLSLRTARAQLARYRELAGAVGPR